ncbi:MULTISPECIES: ABC transporter ATP-binding protein [unclassified Enterococcus]|uniref:amino acid ABC transporter ATP-binding/permease protein n=1 Tax=unclassified Enterococcus TaxID=2608891 RepID=UPI00155810A8|nr:MULTISPECIES: ABC transporter ATP-binding protein [unclassified Enterococcus]MBS7578256.1 ABC transporter ATP-binding protein [Enterococcus sp. MMGLQ5-2]MBS7585695.1 ABC transporter ATP-binding protein [Enterococcus sp. MMGLQ5-1]NPD13554.1 ABC transporter ATP-binding protein [Enterococcus sp. MMGLQ5-1]NPD38087.1 ABC transporter ATP-binding protein [Enterococcus sp. MMGLQ5-2]
MRQAMQTLQWLISFVKPLKFKMIGAIILGSLSYLAVIGIPIIGVLGFINYQNNNNLHITPYIISMIALGICRGILRYGEQYLNHEIAFRTLAIIRDKVFSKLRSLAPAKLQDKKNGELISLITSDVESLEVFFAHTISPVFIAIFISLGMSIWLASFQPILGLLALFIYLLLGVFLPTLTYLHKKKAGGEYKAYYDNLNQEVIEMTKALSEVKLYNIGSSLQQQLKSAGKKLNHSQKEMINQRLAIQNYTELIILLSAFIMLVTAYLLSLSSAAIFVVVISFMSSFGPVLALSGLGNSLLSTLASAKRVYQLLHEQPVTHDIVQGKEVIFSELESNQISFSYPQTQQAVIKQLSFKIPKYGITCIKGASGIGKSTLLKLIMRFWSTDEGIISLSQTPIEEINTSSLRSNEGYMLQDTFLFQDTIRQNITLGKNISDQKVVEALKKASLAEWLNQFENGLDTIIGSAQRQISSGEKQRIALARIFAYDTPLILLDEPTSNLDYLNEKIILNVLEKQKDKQAILIVSHRETTISIADQILNIG